MAKKNLTELSVYDEEGFFRPEKLALVHVTNYMPKMKDGHYEIQSFAEATDYELPRNTIHFTIGHHVGSHLWGNWDNKGIMIVTSLKDTIDKNGLPLGMSTFDTFFETIPGRNLQLPAGTQLSGARDGAGGERPRRRLQLKRQRREDDGQSRRRHRQQRRQHPY